MRVLAASVADASRERGLTVDLRLQNLGKAKTDDVVQLYIRAEDSPFAPPNPVLCGFRRVRLLPGENRTLTLSVPASALTVVNDAGERIFAGGRYTLYAGTSQPDARSRELTGCSPVSVNLRLD